MASHSVGVFLDTVGLSYRSGKLEGKTGPKGEFSYFPDEEVLFSIGSLELGRTKGLPRLTVLDLVDEPSLENPKLLNRARLLFSLTPGLGFEKEIEINETASNVISKHAASINLDASNPTDLDTVLSRICKELGLTVKSVPHVRNHLRRALAGFRVLRDLKIPVRDGAYVLGDIYLPLEQGQYPVLVGSTPYGKRVVYSGPSLEDAEDIAAFEKIEDTWFSTSDDSPLEIPHTGGYFANWTKQRVWETISTFKTFFWVPRGYAMVKIDPRGVVHTPGKRGLFISKNEATDLYDVVEWAAKQPWSSGNIALAGNSYGANCQWRTAIMKPKGLKACFPYGTETDFYRDLTYVGGVPHFDFLNMWRAGVRAVSPQWSEEEDFVETFAEHPFYDDFWDKVNIQLEKLDIPVFIGAAQMLIYHHRGPYEAFRRVASKDKHLQIADTNYYSWPNRETVHKLYLFAERHLKGVEHSDLETVGLQMRIGHGDWYWRTEADWEIPGTEYVDWHLHTDGSIAPETPPGGEDVRVLTYHADVQPKGSSAGVSFVSRPFDTDVELAGHFAATLNISSSSHDADVVVSLWVLDEDGKIVRFQVGPAPAPLVSGFLRASHRKTDPERSFPARPWHTHREKDYAPLRDGEVVEVNVELCPATARIREGWRLRVDILPTEDQPNIPGYQAPKGRSWVKDYHDGAQNSLHLGGNLQNFIRLPIVPLKEVGALNVVPEHI